VSDDDLRATFDQDAELYARARPRYPAELFDELGELAEIGSGVEVAEIGPGTGQATAGLVARGAQVVAVELGARLAGVLRRDLSGTGVEVVVSAFEDWSPPSELFDTLAAFTSWHWLDSAVRTPKARRCVAPERGFGNRHHHPCPWRYRGVLCRRAGLLRTVGPGHRAWHAADAG